MKKRLLSALLSVCMVVTLISATTAHAVSATTVPGGYTAIYTASDLDAVRDNLSGNYILMNDIDLGSFGNWKAIGEQRNGKFGFSGIFDGNGYAILRMNIDDNGVYKNGSVNYAGLFAALDGAIIKNIRNVTGAISIEKAATVYAGGIAGYAKNSSIYNCSSSVVISYNYGTPNGSVVSNVWGMALNAGGIVGFAYDSTHSEQGSTIIERCANYGKISGVASSSTMGIGGIVGDVQPGVTVKDCYNVGDLSAETDFARPDVGGIVGYASSMSAPGCTITNCYNIGDLSIGAEKVNGSGGIGGFISNNKTNVISNCYYLSNTQFAIGSATDTNRMKNISISATKAVSSSDMQKQSTYSGFDFNSVWVMGDSSYPYPKLRALEDGSGITPDSGNSNQPISAPTLKLLTTGDIHSEDEFEIYWNEVPNAESYKIEVINSYGNLTYIDNVSYGNVAYKLTHLAEGAYQIYVTAISGTETAKSNGISVQISASAKNICKTHTFTSAGGDYCTVCGYKFEPTIKPLDITVYAVKDNVPIRDNYYAQNSKTTGRLMKDKGTHVTGSLVNSVGRTWYVITAGDHEYYVYSENVTTTKPAVTIYTITYNANGGTGAPSPSKGINITIPTSPVPTKTGYTFLGYAESATVTTPTYALGQKFVATRDLTLYAVWAEKNYDYSIMAEELLQSIIKGQSNISQIGDTGQKYWEWWDTKYSNRGDSWCAVYASYILNQISVGTFDHSDQINPNNQIYSLNAEGCYHEEPTYKPKTGDLVFFNWYGKQAWNGETGKSGNSDHVGIVIVENDGTIHFLHGNWGASNPPSKVTYSSSADGAGSGWNLSQCIMGYGDMQTYIEVTAD